MLYLVGGASRAGKSKLARRMLLERHIPYLPLDALMMGFANGLPEFGVEPYGPDIEVGEKLWPLVHAMAVDLLETDVDYLIEGACLLPGQVARLVQTYGPAVRTCFIGYTDISPREKLHQIRAFGGEPNDWLQPAPDDEVIAFVDTMLDYSRYLRDECTAHRIRFFDNSHGFLGTLSMAFDYLTMP